MKPGNRVFVEIINEHYDNKFLTGEVVELYTEDSKPMAQVFLDEPLTPYAVICVDQDQLTIMEYDK